jgi:hypothetical protein
VAEQPLRDALVVFGTRYLEVQLRSTRLPCNGWDRGDSPLPLPWGGRLYGLEFGGGLALLAIPHAVGSDKRTVGQEPP